MTIGEFKAWLDGFCEGKDGLNADELSLLRDKASKVVDLRHLWTVPQPLPGPMTGDTPPPWIRGPYAAGVGKCQGATNGAYLVNE